MTQSTRQRFAVYGIKNHMEVLLDTFDTEAEAQTYANVESLQMEHDGAELVVRKIDVKKSSS